MKVTDKRRFTAEGEAREEGEEETDRKAAEASTNTSTGTTTSTSTGAEADADAAAAAGAVAGADAEAEAGKAPRGPLDFATFIESLATVALMHMGLVEVRGEEKIPVNLEFAKEQIDILGLLDEKTRGNLTPDEAQLLAAILRDLRLAYVRMREGPRVS